MTEALFIRLLAEKDKASALSSAVKALREGKKPEGVVFEVDPTSFSEIPGSPFAYWASERIRRLFSELPPLESEGRTAKQGLATADDTRFVRAWWEVDPERIVTGTPETTPDEFRRQTFAGKRWVPFAKGGEYSPYYADLHLVVNWERDGEEIKDYIVRRYPYLNGKWEWVAKNTDFYFRPGLTWLRRTRRLCPKILPRHAIFSDGAQAVFTSEDDLPVILALMASAPFDALVKLSVGRTGDSVQFQAGMIAKIPVPSYKGSSRDLGNHALTLWTLQRDLNTIAENSHVFTLPAILQSQGRSITDRHKHWAHKMSQIEQQVSRLQAEIDELSRRLYGIDYEEWKFIEESDSAADGEREGDEMGASGLESAMNGLLSWCLGVIFGRWDIRLATGQRPLPELPDPFAPLPACSPGMLTGPTGLPAKPDEVPPDYPIPIQWDGIIPDDEGHPQDLIAQVHRVFAVLFPDRDPREVEAEACEILGARSLRSWFAQQFFPYHIKRYSKSRRKAPIYWQLRSSRKSYSIWLYYHRLTADTLWTVLRNYVDPKIEHEQQVLAELRAKLAPVQAAGQSREERRLVKEIQKQEQLLEELTQFRADIFEVANMGYAPDRDDGVLINIAPLYKLVPWSEAEKAWKELLAGKYPWSTMHKRLEISVGTPMRR